MLLQRIHLVSMAVLVLLNYTLELNAQTIRAANDSTVAFRAGDLSVDFWRHYGGEPIQVRGKGHVVSSDFPGEGYQQVVETRNGNDPTGSSGDGFSEFPIALYNRADTGVWAYWSRETFLSSKEYSVEGPSPYFWSHDTVSPSSDNIIAGGFWEGRATFGVPLVFKRQASTDPVAGAIVLGNHGRFWNKSSESVLSEVRGGRVAFKMRVELKEASNDSFAAIFYKKSLASSVIPPTTNELWGAPGYCLAINRSGHLEIWATDVTEPLYSTKDIWWIREWLAAQMGERGVHVEVRTHNWSTDIQEIWLMDTYVPNSKPWLLTTIEHPSPINTGVHFGIAAYSTSGEVRFNERVVADMGLKRKNTFRMAPNNALEFDTIWSSASSDPIELYSATQQLFAAPGWAQGVYCPQFGWSGGSASAQLYGKPQDFFVGKRIGNQRRAGLTVQIIRAEVDGKPSPGAYASLQYVAGKLAIIHANALSEQLWRGDGADDDYQFRDVRLTTRLSYRP